MKLIPNSIEYELKKKSCLVMVRVVVLKRRYTRFSRGTELKGGVYMYACVTKRVYFKELVYVLVEV